MEVNHVHADGSNVINQNGNSNGVVSPPSPGGGAAAAGGDDNSYFDSLPDGYRFMPTEEEIILCYLIKKINNLPLPPNRIKNVDFYEKPPEIFAEEHPLHREKERYFFTSRDRKYSKGERPGRTVKDVGFWKATGCEKIIKDEKNKDIIGYRKMLVFYRGVAKQNQKTNWVMLEYVAHLKEKRKPKNKDDMKLDDWVIVKLYEKNKENTKNQEDDHDEGTPKPANTSATPQKRARKKRKMKKERENEINTHESPPFDGEYSLPSANHHAFNDNPILATYASTSLTPNGQQARQASFNTTVPLNNIMFSTHSGFSSSNLCASQCFDGLNNANYADAIHSEPFLEPMNGAPTESLDQQFQASNCHPAYPPQVPSNHHYTQYLDFSGHYGDGITYEAETQMGFDSSSNGMLNGQNMMDQSFGCETVIMEPVSTQNVYTDQRVHFNSAPIQPHTGETFTGLGTTPYQLGQFVELKNIG